MILLIDNYDSFTFNIYQMIASKTDCLVVRNDKITIDGIKNLKPTGIIISPGPGSPKDAGISNDVIKEFVGKIPILGICLGHQAICECFGSLIVHARLIYHGMRSLITLLDAGKNSPLFRGVNEKFFGGRYHSLVADRLNPPKKLDVAAVSEDGEIMAVLNDSMRVYGIQFHPESVLTPDGDLILNNFLQICYEEVMDDAKRSA